MDEYLMAISGVPPIDSGEAERQKLHLATEKSLGRMFPAPPWLESMWHYHMLWGT